MHEPTLLIHGVEAEGRCCLSDQSGEVIVVSSPELNLQYARFRPAEFTKLVKMSARQLPIKGNDLPAAALPMTDSGS